MASRRATKELDSGNKLWRTRDQEKVNFPDEDLQRFLNECTLSSSDKRLDLAHLPPGIGALSRVGRLSSESSATSRWSNNSSNSERSRKSSSPKALRQSHCALASQDFDSILQQLFPP